MKSKTAPTVEPRNVPEVIEFLDSQDAVDTFILQHAQIFDDFRVLVERRNAALEQADKACRTKQISCGPFDLYQITTKYNAEKLYNAVGRDQFLSMGGTVSTVTDYKLDRGRFEACIAQNKISGEVLEQVRSEVPNFHKPDKIVV